MKEIFQAGQLNLVLFESQLLQQTKNLTEVLAAARRTQSAQVESTHFLIALIRISASFTQDFFRQKGITPAELESGLVGLASAEPNTTPPAKLAPATLGESGKKLIATLEKLLEQGKIFQIDEVCLLLATLENLTPEVLEIFDIVKLPPYEMIDELRQRCEHPVDQPSPFDGNLVQMASFSPGAQRVLKLMETEAEALGYSQMDPRHLLLALLEVEGGATHMALYQQDILPKKIQERVMLNLRARAQKMRTRLELNKTCLSSTLTYILEQTAGETRVDRARQIAEVHLFRAFLQSDSFAVRQLVDAGVGLQAAIESARQFKPEEEAIPVSSNDIKPWQTIKADLEDALIGQQDAIEMCLPFIRRMLFDFRRPGKPAGVFLFCGPSGSGKTEMAKAIARAVFGSEENLIMLEMGQFQTKESMNIFVGAPPGYIGYGEGKLTNGLRDKPRSVVLFDEVEKAYPEVFDALLRFIDEGRIDDPAGPVRDGSECIIVLTSNVSTKGLEKLVNEGDYKKNKWQIRRKLKEALQNLSVERSPGSQEREPFRFRSEFLNRIDEIILFRALEEKDLTEIARRHLKKYIERLKDEKQIELAFAPNIDAAARLIGHFCATLDEGARATLRTTQTAVLDPVIDFVYEKGCFFPVSLVIHFPQAEAMVEPRGSVGFLDE